MHRRIEQLNEDYRNRMTEVMQACSNKP